MKATNKCISQNLDWKQKHFFPPSVVTALRPMIDGLRQQHFSAATPCKHAELRIVKCDPKGDPVLQKYTVLLILSASLLDPSSYFSYVTG